MKKHSLLVGICTLGLFFSCATNPFTGKQSLNFVSNSQLFPSSFQQYGTFLKENKVIVGTTDAKRVETVGMKIKAAAERQVVKKPPFFTISPQKNHLQIAIHSF